MRKSECLGIFISCDVLRRHFTEPREQAIYGKQPSSDIWFRQRLKERLRIEAIETHPVFFPYPLQASHQQGWQALSNLLNRVGSRSQVDRIRDPAHCLREIIKGLLDNSLVELREGQRAQARRRDYPAPLIVPAAGYDEREADIAGAGAVHKLVDTAQPRSQ